ncbi:MAG: PEGA domain-containing protein [Cryomorphaceae bacterium]|nr:PEGA domain-containing protein [Cryomorphaceae bacterium]
MKHLYPIIFILTTLSLNAQLREFHITEREPDASQVVQANTQYPDNAMILVYSDLEGLDFRSSVGGINQQRYNARANRYEILVNPQRQILFVAARGFIEQRIALINPSPKQVHYYLVEERGGQDEISVIFLVEPRDAKLYVENIPTEINKTVNVPLGTVKIRIEREGYRTVNSDLLIKAEQVNYEFSLQEVDLELVHIDANESDARVIVNGLEKGVTDNNKRLSLFLYSGDYTIEVQKNGFLTETQAIEVVEGRVNNFRFNLEKNTGILVIKVSPSDATVLINKRSCGNSRRIELAPGRYRVDFEARNFDAFSETIEIRRGQTRTLTASLEQHTGTLQFSVTPSTARVILKDNDGKVVERWIGNNLVRNLKVGTYTLELSGNGYRSKTLSFSINNDKAERVSFAMVEGEDRSRLERRREKRVRVSDDHIHVKVFNINKKRWIFIPSYIDCPVHYWEASDSEYAEIRYFIILSEDLILKEAYSRFTHCKICRGKTLFHNIIETSGKIIVTITGLSYIVLIAIALS